jgi:hypothetical protein
LSLPSELRVQIYQYVLSPVLIDIKPNEVFRPDLSLLSTCRQIGREASIYVDYADLLIVGSIPAVKEIARYLGRDICAKLQTLRLKETTSEWMMETLWRDWGKMNICLETFPSLKRVAAIKNEEVKDSKLAGFVLNTFWVPGLQVDVVEADWKHSVCYSRKLRRTKPVLETQDL